MTVVWVVVGVGLLVGLLALWAGRRTSAVADDEHSWSLDLHRGEVRIPRER